jgi:hypothetical protein
VLLSGEAGIGKSRLTAALMECLAAEPHTRLRYFCSPQHTDSALYPIIGQMERAAGFAHDDSAHAKLDKLDGVLAQGFTPREDAALFAEMLSLPNDGRYPAPELTPEQRRQKTLQALTDGRNPAHQNSNSVGGAKHRSAGAGTSRAGAVVVTARVLRQGSECRPGGMAETRCGPVWILPVGSDHVGDRPTVAERPANRSGY